MNHPPRNRELERLVIDALCATPVSSPERHAAWQVYADWLLSLGEPVGEWLAASLRADDASDAAAPIRARLSEIERACRFRLVDNELADLSEVPQLTRIAELTWERGFITQAEFRCREFRPWDSSLLRHTPDRLLEVVLRSPSACMLHRVELDRYEFEAEGSRRLDLAELLAALPEPPPLRTLVLAVEDAPIGFDAETFRALPELRHLSLSRRPPAQGSSRPRGHQRLVPAFQPPADPRREQRARTRLSLAQLLAFTWPEQLERLERLEIVCRGEGDVVARALSDSALLDRLRSVRIGHVGELGAAAIGKAHERFARLDHVELVEADQLPPALEQALRQAGCVISRGPGAAPALT